MERIALPMFLIININHCPLRVRKSISIHADIKHVFPLFFLKCKFSDVKQQEVMIIWLWVGASYKAAWFMVLRPAFYSTVPSSLLISAALSKPLLSHYRLTDRKRK